MPKIANDAGMLVSGIHVRFDVDERPMVSVADLAKAKDPALRELARVDGSTSRKSTVGGRKDGWLGLDEIDDQLVSARAWQKFTDLVIQAREQQLGLHPLALRRQNGEHPAALSPGPAPLARKAAALADEPRASFVPLAEYIAERFLAAKSYKSTFGDRMYYIDATDLVSRYSLHELEAALAIVTYREGDTEFALTRRKDGRAFLVQGGSHYVDMVAKYVGTDQVFHTHPKFDLAAVRPSSGDLGMVGSVDPDHRGAVVTCEGWTVEFNDRGVVGRASRLWKTSARAAARL